jgi:hypothetical protein
MRRKVFTAAPSKKRGNAFAGRAVNRSSTVFAARKRGEKWIKRIGQFGGL